MNKEEYDKKDVINGYRQLHDINKFLSAMVRILDGNSEVGVQV